MFASYAQAVSQLSVLSVRKEALPRGSPEKRPYNRRFLRSLNNAKFWCRRVGSLGERAGRGDFLASSGLGEPISYRRMPVISKA